MKEFRAQRLRDRRRGLGITQHELARRAGVSTVTISALENAKKEPRAGTVARLAVSLDCGVEYFFA